MISLTNRFKDFLERRATTGGVETCVVEFVFSPNVALQLGGVTEKARAALLGSWVVCKGGVLPDSNERF